MTKKNEERIKKILAEIPYSEGDFTNELFRKLGNLKKQGYITKSQAIKILKWKSPRPLRYYESNSPKDFKEITKIAFNTKNERLRIHILTALRGVKYPAASALLMFYDKTRYPVIDIRVWKQLFKAGYVSSNAKGQGFTLEEWELYLEVIRNLAAKHNLIVRQVEKKLFDADKKWQRGNLYK
jgi:hypothetical protein